jgi:hypothetical protein
MPWREEFSDVYLFIHGLGCYEGPTFGCFLDKTFPSFLFFFWILSLINIYMYIYIFVYNQSAS